MAGIIPAPATPTKLRLGVTDTYQAGNITLSPGVALAGTRNGAQFTFDAEPFDQLMPAGLFLPSLAAAVDVATFAQLRPSGAVRLRYVEINLTSAPIAADGTNNLGLKIRDAGGTNAVTLPMSSTGKRFTFDGAANDVKMSVPTDGTGLGLGRGYWQSVRPSANMTITGLKFTVLNSNAGVGGSKIVEILDNAGNVLGQSAPFLGAVDATAINLLAAVTLVQGVDYWVGFRYVTGELAGPDITPGAHNNNSADVGFANGTGLGARQITAVGQTFANATQVATASFPLAFSAFGVTSGLRIPGDVHVDLVAAGTGGTPSAGGANIRLHWVQST